MKTNRLFLSHRSAPRVLLLVAAAAVILLAGCDKQCHCYAYDGTQPFYTEEEVEAYGGNCADMAYFANIRRYSLCEWDY